MAGSTSFDSATTYCADAIDLNALECIIFSCTLACGLSSGIFGFVAAYFLSLDLTCIYFDES